jgi:DNA-binding transcriptional LysR family regulator
VSSFILPKALSAFRSSWPAVQVLINIGLCNGLRERVRHAELDAALTLDGSLTSPENSDRCSRTLSPAQLCFIVSRSLKSGEITREKLTDRTFLLPDPDGAFPTLLRNWFGTSGSPRFESAGSIEGVKSGVLNSDAIGVLPNYAVSTELSNRSLFALKVREPLPAIYVGLSLERPPIEASPLYSLIGQVEKVLSGAHLM